jgi:hypothetical protein
MSQSQAALFQTPYLLKWLLRGCQQAQTSSAASTGTASSAADATIIAPPLTGGAAVGPATVVAVGNPRSVVGVCAAVVGAIAGAGAGAMISSGGNKMERRIFRTRWCIGRDDFGNVRPALRPEGHSAIVLHSHLQHAALQQRRKHST